MRDYEKFEKRLKMLVKDRLRVNRSGELFTIYANYNQYMAGFQQRHILIDTLDHLDINYSIMNNTSTVLVRYCDKFMNMDDDAFELWMELI